MRKLASLAFSFSVLGLIYACSSADPKPAAATNLEGGGGSSGSSGGEDAGGDATKDYPASCRDTTMNNGETDVDCGGSDCPPCALGKKCNAPTDCADQGATCDNKICALCKDGNKNGSETDIDCGGTACGTCGIGKNCMVAADCTSGVCNTGGKCACPDATMVSIALGLGKPTFCVDRTEVTNGQYNAFVNANKDPSDPTVQPVAACQTANKSFVPLHAWPPHTAPPTMSGNSLSFNMGLPAHYIDWCDAYAYCKYAGKRLCGTLDGQSVSPADANDASKSAWYNTCTAQGQHAYPYGPNFDMTLCNGTGMGEQGVDPTVMKDVVNAHYGVDSNEDHGIYEIVTADDNGIISGVEHTLCQGGTVGIYQMSGNVAEWEDNCDGADATSNCRLRGGSYAANNDSAALACAANRSAPRMPTDVTVLADVGFRCCAY